MKHFTKIFLSVLLAWFQCCNTSEESSEPTAPTPTPISHNENVPEIFEYPRYNKKVTHKIERMWKNYYICLKQQQNSEEKKPEIRRLLEGQNTEFQCDICSKPFQNYEELEWKYKPLSPESGIQNLEILDLTPEMVLTKEKTLKIFNAVEGFSGLYVCFHKKNVINVYVLEVSKNDTTEKVSSSLTKKVHINLEGMDFQIYYQWTEWSECSACDTIGRKYKYGTCYISMKKVKSAKTNEDKHLVKKSTFPMSVKSFNLGENSIVKYLKKKFFANSNGTEEDNARQPWEVHAIKKFATGIPCASQYIPTSVIEFLEKQAPIKVLVEYCSETCHRSQIFELLDISGRIIEKANNSAGIFSVFQGLPVLPPDIAHRSLTGNFGKDVIIQCPGTSLRNIPVTWRAKKKIILPEVVANESNGRFVVDLVNRIHIKKLRLKDSLIYSCWQKGRLVGTVHLSVEKNFSFGLNHHVTLIGTLLITVIMIFLGAKALAKELRYR